MQHNLEKLYDIFADKKVLFVTHKTADYLRNNQEIKMVERYCSYIKVISADAKLKWIRYFISISKVLLILVFSRKGKYDVIFFGYLPQFVIPFFPFVLGKKIIVIDFFISLYDTMVFDKKLMSKNHPVARIAKWADRITLSKANCIIVDTKAHGKFFALTLGADYRKMFVLYLEADPDIYFPKNVKKPCTLKGKFIVLYFGTILPLQGAEVILKAARKFENNPDFFFIIIGPIKGKLSAIYKDLSNSLFVPWVEQDTLSYYIAMSDLCLAGHFDRTIEKAKRVIPGKAFIYRAMNKPMILGENPANREVFSEEANGVHFVEMGNEKLLFEKIAELSRQKNDQHG